jgi:N utilization substance protein B
MGRRTKARECAFQMLYQWSVTGEPMSSVAAAFWRLRTATEETQQRAEALARGAAERVAELDSAIARASTHWRLERIAGVDLSVLRLATYELVATETPGPVVIDEAVDMARRFGESESPAFVNGVLDAILRTVRGGGEEKRVRGA